MDQPGAAVGISHGILTSSSRFTGQMSRGEVTQHPSRHNHRNFLVDKGFLRFHSFGLDNLKHSLRNQWRQRVRGQESGCLQNCNKQRGASELEGGPTDQILQLWEQLTVSLVDCGVMTQQLSKTVAKNIRARVDSWKDPVTETQKRYKDASETTSASWEP